MPPQYELIWQLGFDTVGLRMSTPSAPHKEKLECLAPIGNHWILSILLPHTRDPLKSSKLQHQVVVFLEIGEWMVVLSWMVALQMSHFAVAGRRFEIACYLGRKNPSNFGII